MEPPDREEKAIRFGCGALLGLLVVGLAVFKLSGISWPWWVGVAAVVVVGFGYEALRRGDEFWWETLGNRWWRWR